ncbi:MAG: methylated-DNA--[protein]-cysteine S-methyltransferase [Marmoricola sp.]|nr:methylated-DNA--[protein]-cysteine S-methyltransferase [Marmoricola sp.]
MSTVSTPAQPATTVPVWTVVDSPIGELRLVAHDGSLVAVDFSPFEPTDARVAAGERHDDDPVLVRTRDQLAAYFAGRLTDFDLPLAPRGTEFQRRVWDQLRTVGYGRTASYGEVARALGMTGAASRAVGLANGRNPIPVVIPCHRVVGADGTLTGYAGGLDRKRRLLDLEQEGLF